MVPLDYELVIICTHSVHTTVCICDKVARDVFTCMCNTTPDDNHSSQPHYYHVTIRILFFEDFFYSSMSSADIDRLSVRLQLKQRALQKHFENLADAIIDPDRFASKLYSKGYIDRGSRENITSRTGITRYSKALQLLNVVEAKVKTDRYAFKKFSRILRDVYRPQGDALLTTYR